MIDLRALTLKSSPNQFLVAPDGFGTAKPHKRSSEYALPAADLARRFREIALSEPRTVLAGEGAGGLRFDLVQRSQIFRFPDTISVEVLPLGDRRSTLAIYSRSKIGYSDWGVNRKRIERWLARVGH
jgi:uncharacterized protein (DUF1499 family)